MMKKVLASVCFCICAVLSAADGKVQLYFSGQPESGKNYLCSYSGRTDIRSYMKMQGKQQPVRQDIATFSLSGSLSVITPEVREFTPGNYSLVRNGIPDENADFSGKTIRMTGNEKYEIVQPQAHPFFPDQSQPVSVPASLRLLLRDLTELIQNKNNQMFGKDTHRKPGETWTVNPEFIKMLEKNSSVDSVDWTSKITFDGITGYQGISAAVLRLELISKPRPGYDCKIAAVYRFAVEKPSVPLSLEMEWNEVIDRVMPDNNPVFSGTHFTEVRIIQLNASFLPL